MNFKLFYKIIKMDTSDIEYRYTGNRRQTVLLNFLNYCQVHNLNIKETVKLVKKVLGTNCFVEDNNLIIKGDFTNNDIYTALL